MDKLKRIIGTSQTVYIESLTLDEPFIDLADKFAHIPGTVALISGSQLDCARYHIIATYPFLSMTANRKSVTFTTDTDTITCEIDPFLAAKQVITQLTLQNFKTDLPVASGLFGYFSYDLKNCIETLPRTTYDDLNLPYYCLFAPTVLLVHDRQSQKSSLCILIRQTDDKQFIENTRQKVIQTLKHSRPVCHSTDTITGELKSNFEKNDYLKAISRIREYISSGHVYQVNMSQRFQMDFDQDPYTLFKALFKNNPAPFFAFINAGDHAIVSTSPERFLLRTGNELETRPIKGTRKRGQNNFDDRQLKNQLLESPKDDAELSMIVDLLRNDIGKVCQGGSVKVTEHKRIEAYQNVFHLISIIKGILKPDTDSIDIIKATFPGGSITGCPKIRSMEIIDELEPHARHIYTGSIGYVSFHDTMDLSIAIRTATIYNRKLFFSVGGGIVFDSDPEDEYEETLHKGKTLMEIFSKHHARKDSAKKTDIVWQNGSMIPIEKASIPIADLGALYGYGFFETMRAVNGRVKHLCAHIGRFNRTWQQLFFSSPPDLTWETIIEQVLVENQLDRAMASVKILTTKGSSETPPLNNRILIMAKPYVHRLVQIDKPGLNLLTYPHPRFSPLADFKTINYLYYYMAQQWVKSQKADEALILNPDKSVSETSTGNLLCIKDRSIIIPHSEHVLGGVMHKQVLDLLTRWGYSVEFKKIFLPDIFQFETILVTNALMGAVPVLAIDDNRVDSDLSLALRLNDQLL